MAKEDRDLTTELQQCLLCNARYASSSDFVAHWDSLSNYGELAVDDDDQAAAILAANAANQKV